MARFTALALLGLFATTSNAADWPQWLGPKRDGSTSEIVSPWKDKPKEAWRVKVGPGFSTPVIADGRVFIHAQDGTKDREVVFAFDAKTGKELWQPSLASSSLLEHCFISLPI